MLLRDSLSLIFGPAPAARRGRARRQLRLEPLDERALPSGTVTLASSDDSPLVGERIAWTATATDVGVSPVYQFSAAPDGGAFHVVRDFSPTNTFTWTPMQEGDYDIRVVAKDGYTATDTTSAVATDAVGSLVPSSQAVVTPTLNPLVALYSVPPSSAGAVRVQFALAGDNPTWRNTDVRTVVPGKSTNVFVAGMLPETTYQMRHVFSDGTASAPLLFTTGALPSTLTFPVLTATQPPGPASDTDQDMVLNAFTGPTVANNRVANPIATDLSGRVEWYFDPQQSGLVLTTFGAGPP